MTHENAAFAVVASRRMFDEHPEWREHCYLADSQSIAQDGCEIRLPTPIGCVCSHMQTVIITTEIYVRFHSFHQHFVTEYGANDAIDGAIRFMEDILSERIIIETKYDQGRVRTSRPLFTDIDAEPQDTPITSLGMIVAFDPQAEDKPKKKRKRWFTPEQPLDVTLRSFKTTYDEDHFHGRKPVYPEGDEAHDIFALEHAHAYNPD